MKQYDQHELDTKIKVFLADKLQKYPDIELEQPTMRANTEPSLASRLVESLTLLKPLVAN